VQYRAREGGQPVVQRYAVSVFLEVFCCFFLHEIIDYFYFSPFAQAAAERALRARHYAVVPLSDSGGLIQLVDGALPLCVV
jgi:hypothetical protein